MRQAPSPLFVTLSPTVFQRDVRTTEYKSTDEIHQDPKDLFPDIWHWDPSLSLSVHETSLRKLIVDAGMTTLECEVCSSEAFFRTEAEVLGVVYWCFLLDGATEGQVIMVEEGKYGKYGRPTWVPQGLEILVATSLDSIFCRLARTHGGGNPGNKSIAVSPCL
ncbi:hypothetical protein HPB47_016314 [Ixodes persulcatus]|uniref:Uncharacterized protein n=1 Tax=Ixodes persulcatus TaxID=34615 RepID=A0AC60QUW3_IXOPE|nr:hypothetical protein HPB47_016314 [Ixodes persulcatus]